MSGKFHGLRALFLRDCPYAYFVHCFAHKLQLTLVASAKVCDHVWDFFSLLDCIINIVKSSPKRIMELQAIHKKDINGMLKLGEIQSGQGANQMRSLTRAGQTRWHSHYHYVLSIIDMFHATCEVLRDISDNSLNSRFNESSVRLLQLSVALDPKDSFRSFNEGDIYKLAEEVYPQDLEDYEMHCLRSELRFYNTHVVHNQEYAVSSLAMLLEKLVETRMDLHYKMICRLMRLVLTLPVSTATIERSFSTMKFVKTDLRNKMSDEFVEDYLTIFLRESMPLI
ncbi:hypothetical protein LINPERPRIM_LOCUS20008 [Linum perenne]